MRNQVMQNEFQSERFLFLSKVERTLQLCEIVRFLSAKTTMVAFSKFKCTPHKFVLQTHTSSQNFGGKFSQCATHHSSRCSQDIQSFQKASVPHHQAFSQSQTQLYNTQKSIFASCTSNPKHQFLYRFFLLSCTSQSATLLSLHAIQ